VIDEIFYICVILPIPIEDSKDSWPFSRRFILKNGIALCFLLLILAGCVTTGGKNLDVSEISKGHSTKQDVIDAIGDPDQEIELGDGRTVCTWVSVRKSENLFVGALITKGVDNTAQERENGTTGKEVTTVQITFSAKGIVQQITKSKSGHLAK
jgi:hypothetical protein